MSQNEYLGSYSSLSIATENELISSGSK